MSFDSVWMTAQTAAKYLDFTGKKPAEAFRMWAKRLGVPTFRRGKRVLYDPADLQRAIGDYPARRKLALGAAPAHRKLAS